MIQRQLMPRILPAALLLALTATSASAQVLRHEVPTDTGGAWITPESLLSSPDGIRILGSGNDAALLAFDRRGAQMAAVRNGVAVVRNGRQLTFVEQYSNSGGVAVVAITDRPGFPIDVSAAGPSGVAATAR